jgi:hypothetical protein
MDSVKERCKSGNIFNTVLKFFIKIDSKTRQKMLNMGVKTDFLAIPFLDKSGKTLFIVPLDESNVEVAAYIKRAIDAYEGD